MKILVNVGGRELTYDSDGHTVRVGDTVILPTPKWKRDMGDDDTCEGVVVSLCSRYAGPLKSIIGPKVDTLIDVNEIVELVENAKVIHIDGKRYTRKNGWVRG